MLSNQQNSSAVKVVKKTYVKPQLIIHGLVQEVTLIASSTSGGV